MYINTLGNFAAEVATLEIPDAEKQSLFTEPPRAHSRSRSALPKVVSLLSCIHCKQYEIKDLILVRQRRGFLPLTQIALINHFSLSFFLPRMCARARVRVCVFSDKVEHRPRPL